MRALFAATLRIEIAGAATRETPPFGGYRSVPSRLVPR